MSIFLPEPGHVHGVFSDDVPSLLARTCAAAARTGRPVHLVSDIILAGVTQYVPGDLMVDLAVATARASEDGGTMVVDATSFSGEDYSLVGDVCRHAVSLDVPVVFVGHRARLDVVRRACSLVAEYPGMVTG